MTNIISFPCRIGTDDAIARQLAAIDSALAGEIRELGQIVRVFQKKAVTSLVTAIGDLEHGTTQLRIAARLVEADPLRSSIEAEIIKIEHLVDDARRFLSGSL